MKCPICESDNVRGIYRHFPGYIAGTDFDIFECTKCDTQFISTETLDPKIYNIVYSSDDIPGYYRYINYAKEIKKKKNPLRYLSQEESVYYPVYDFLIDKPRLDILEVGCGYGYLTYSINALGHNIEGIDISRAAIQYASLHFGDYYKVATLNDYKTDKKFDLIIATELIEHLIDPAEFIRLCANLLNTHGKIILTTRNKDCYHKESVWRTDLPPMHTMWLSKTSFKHLAEKAKLNCFFVDFTKYVGRNENNLAWFFYTRWMSNKLPKAIVNEKGDANRKGVGRFARNIFKNILFFAPVRYSCSYINRLFTKEHNTLGVIMNKKN